MPKVSHIDTVPFRSASKITLCKMAANPRATNIRGEEVRIETVPISAPVQSGSAGGRWKVDDSTGGTAKGLPPCAIYLYVFEATI